MKKTIKSMLIKAIIMWLFIRGFTIIETSISPIIQNYLALNQMNNSTDSFIGIRLYTECVQHGWVLTIIVALVLFYEDVAKIIKLLKIKGEIKNEKGND